MTKCRIVICLIKRYQRNGAIEFFPCCSLRLYLKKSGSDIIESRWPWGSPPLISLKTGKISTGLISRRWLEACCNAPGRFSQFKIVSDPWWTIGLGREWRRLSARVWGALWWSKGFRTADAGVEPQAANEARRAMMLSDKQLGADKPLMTCRLGRFPVPFEPVDNCVKLRLNGPQCKYVGVGWGFRQSKWDVSEAIPFPEAPGYESTFSGSKDQYGLETFTYGSLK